MHYTLDLSNVLAVNRRFIEGWENKNFEWTDWSRIQAFLREAKFQQKGKKWTCKDVEMPPEVLGLIKVHAVNKALADAEEKAKKAVEEEDAGIKEVKERLSRIETVLDTLAEKMNQIK